MVVVIYFNSVDLVFSFLFLLMVFIGYMFNGCYLFVVCCVNLVLWALDFRCRCGCLCCLARDLSGLVLVCGDACCALLFG